MLSIIGLIPTVLTFITGLGTTASSISKDIRDLQIAKEQTKSNKELKEIDGEVQVKLAQKDVLVAEAGNRINGALRAALALGPVLYVFKYYAVDKFLGSIVGCSGIGAGAIPGCKIFATDPLNPEMTVVLSAVIGFYLLHATFRK